MLPYMLANALLIVVEYFFLHIVSLSLHSVCAFS